MVGPHSTERTLWSEVERVASRRVLAAAIVFEDWNLSYADLVRLVPRLAAFLQQRGLIAGDRVAYVASNSPVFVLTLLACSRSGFVLVPINEHLTAIEIGQIVTDAGAKVLLCDLEQKRKLDASADSLRRAPPMVLLTRTEIELIRTTEVSAALPAPLQGARSTVLQMYTSGTTGGSKGAMLSNGALLAVSKEAIERLGGFVDSDVVLVCLPLFHIAGADLALFSLLSGAQLTILRRPDPIEILSSITAHGVTKTLLVPAVVRSLVSSLEGTPRNISSLQTICFGASPMPAELIARLRLVSQADLIHVYGLTETSGMITWLPPNEIAKGRRLSSCGKAFPSGALAIADPRGQHLGANQSGEVIYRGPQVMSGYWNKPTQTDEALSGGWFRTGDIGYLDEEGFLYIHGRLKDMIKSGDENVYPAEIENVLLQCPGVADAAVIGVADERWGEAVTAVIIARDEPALNLSQLDNFVRSRLAGFKVPKTYFIRSTLPRNAAGKVLKQALRAALKTASRNGRVLTDPT